MNKNILDRILDAQREFRRQNQRDPSAVHLTLEDEMKISRLKWDELGPVLETIVREGVRKALPTIFGLKVVYGAPQFSME
jgi:hypothetical protein